MTPSLPLYSGCSLVCVFSSRPPSVSATAIRILKKTPTSLPSSASRSAAGETALSIQWRDRVCLGTDRFRRLHAVTRCHTLLHAQSLTVTHSESTRALLYEINHRAERQRANKLEKSYNMIRQFRGCFLFLFKLTRSIYTFSVYSPTHSFTHSTTVTRCHSLSLTVTVIAPECRDGTSSDGEGGSRRRSGWLVYCCFLSHKPTPLTHSLSLTVTRCHSLSLAVTHRHRHRPRM